MVSNDDLSVIRETMPPGSSEQLHYHEKAQQFFYILNGNATFEIDGIVFEAEGGEGIQIMPGSRHRIRNMSSGTLEFLVISQPSTKGDRINCE